MDVYATTEVRVLETVTITLEVGVSVMVLVDTVVVEVVDRFNVDVLQARLGRGV